MEETMYYLCTMMITSVFTRDKAEFQNTKMSVCTQCGTSLEQAYDKYYDLIKTASKNLSSDTYNEVISVEAPKPGELVLLEDTYKFFDFNYATLQDIDDKDEHVWYDDQSDLSGWTAVRYSYLYMITTDHDFDLKSYAVDKYVIKGLDKNYSEEKFKEILDNAIYTKWEDRPANIFDPKFNPYILPKECYNSSIEFKGWQPNYIYAYDYVLHLTFDKKHLKHEIRKIEDKIFTDKDSAQKFVALKMARTGVFRPEEYKNVDPFELVQRTISTGLIYDGAGESDKIIEFIVCSKDPKYNILDDINKRLALEIAHFEYCNEDDEENKPTLPKFIITIHKSDIINKEPYPYAYHLAITYEDAVKYLEEFVNDFVKNSYITPITYHLSKYTEEGGHSGFIKLDKSLQITTNFYSFKPSGTSVPYVFIKTEDCYYACTILPVK